MCLRGEMAKYEESEIEAGYQLFTKDPGRCVQRPPPSNYLVLVKIFQCSSNLHQENTDLGLPGSPWLKICLPTQGTWVQSLVWKNPT